MKVFIYQAALHCEDCGIAIRQNLSNAGKAPADQDDESTYDSDDFPKGPYPDGGGEADSPQHCDACHAFLENPLTPDGVAYARDLIGVARASGKMESVAVTLWAEYYRDELSELA